MIKLFAGILAELPKVIIIITTYYNTFLNIYF